MFNNKVNNFIKDKTSDKVKPKILISSALTAVTLAYISSRLTTIVNSVILVAVVSILAALFNEFYRIFFEGLHQIFSQSVDKELEDDEEEEELPKKSLNRTGLSKLLSSRWAPNVIFALVATLTLVGAAYVNQQKPPEYKIEQRIIKKEEVSPKVEGEIISQAEEKARLEAEKVEYLTNKNIQTETGLLMEEIERLRKSTESYEKTQAEMKDEISKLESELETLRGEVRSLREAQDNPVD